MARRRPDHESMGDTVAKRVDSTSTDSVDRRSFLKGAAAGAAGAASAIVSRHGHCPAGRARERTPGRRAADRSRRARGLRAARAARRRAVHPAPRLRLHGRRAEGARLRLRRRESRLGFRGPARVDHQSRRQPQARDPDGPARGSRRRDRARLRQGGRQADDDADARHGRAAARRRWACSKRGATASPYSPSSATTAIRRASSIARTARRTWAPSSATS